MGEKGVGWDGLHQNGGNCGALRQLWGIRPHADADYARMRQDGRLLPGLQKAQEQAAGLLPALLFRGICAVGIRRPFYCRPVRPEGELL